MDQTTWGQTKFEKQQDGKIGRTKLTQNLQSGDQKRFQGPGREYLNEKRYSKCHHLQHISTIKFNDFTHFLLTQNVTLCRCEKVTQKQGDSYFNKFEISNFACSHVLLLGSLVSELFLFLLYDLSFPCGYFFSASMGNSTGK